MKWEIYKQLSKTQKEEYEYRFGKSNFHNHIIFAQCILAILFFLTLDLIMGAVILTVDEVNHLTPYLLPIMQQFSKLATIVMITLCIYTIYILIVLTITIRNVMKWKKENKIDELEKKQISKFKKAFNWVIGRGK